MFCDKCGRFNDTETGCHICKACQGEVRALAMILWLLSIGLLVCVVFLIDYFLK